MITTAPFYSQLWLIRKITTVAPAKDYLACQLCLLTYGTGRLSRDVFSYK